MRICGMFMRKLMGERNFSTQSNLRWGIERDQIHIYILLIEGEKISTENRPYIVHHVHTNYEKDLCKPDLWEQQLAINKKIWTTYKPIKTQENYRIYIYEEFSFFNTSTSRIIYIYIYVKMELDLLIFFLGINISSCI